MKNIKKKIQMLNPDIFRFTEDSSFINEPVQSNIYYNKLSDKNHMKLNNNEFSLLNKFY